MMAGVLTGNPILIGAGAVTYGGAVIYENREAIANGAKAVGNFLADTGRKATDMQIQAAKTVLKKGGEMKDAVIQRAQVAKQRLGQAFDRTRNSINQTAQTMKRHAVNTVKAGVEYARANNLKIRPVCPYAKKVIDATAEFHDVLAG
jgi:predicted GNAT family acetyltransferase